MSYPRNPSSNTEMQNAPAPILLSCPIVTNVSDSEIIVSDESRLA